MSMVKKLFLLLLVIPLWSCSSVVSGTAVYAVGKYSQVQEKRTKKYTYLDKCMDESKPSAYLLAESIAYGEAVTGKYNDILSDLKNPYGGPVEPHQLAYAFYYIAKVIGDVRGYERIGWLKGYMTEDEAKDIREGIDEKYKKSYLVKCFTVPDQHKLEKSIRDSISE